MKILALNCGSSSVKYGLFELGESEDELARGVVEHIGSGPARHSQQLSNGTGMIKDAGSFSDHDKAINSALESLIHPDYGIISSLSEIEAVGHRVVHGGERFSGTVIVNEEVMQALHGHVDLAPLHNPFNIMGIEAMGSILPKIPQVAVFDTAFHHTLPQRAYLYAIPLELYERHGIRRYGFHGTSHRYVAHEAARLLCRPLQELRLLSCHLGGGASIAAIKYGQSIDTSMGFAPLEGLVMGTRCGDIDPSIIVFLMQKDGLDAAAMQELLNRRSGLLGISGYTSDMQRIEEAAYADESQGIPNSSREHHRRAKLALDIFIYRLKKYIGAYSAAMGGVDAVVFTGGIGERSAIVPEEACSELEFMGIELGERINFGKGCYELSRPESRVRVLVIPSDEQLIIARDTYQIVRGSPSK